MGAFRGVFKHCETFVERDPSASLCRFYVFYDSLVCESENVAAAIVPTAPACPIARLIEVSNEHGALSAPQGHFWMEVGAFSAQGTLQFEPGAFSAQ